MKYLVTWNYTGNPITWAGGCRYYDDKIAAYNDYKLFKGNSNFHNVHFIEIKEKGDEVDG